MSSKQIRTKDLGGRKMTTFLIYWLIASVIFTLGYCLGYRVRHWRDIRWMDRALRVSLKKIREEDRIYEGYRNKSSRC